MTDDADREQVAPKDPPTRPSGLSLAALVLGVVSLVLTAAAWAAWFLVVPSGSSVSFGWFAYTPRQESAPFEAIAPHGWIGVVVALVIGALWFAMLPASVLGFVFARLARRGTEPGSVTARVARAAISTSGPALFLALAGAVLFCVALSAPELSGMRGFSG
ncbi:MAG: hypothetical protein GEU98_18855 [Pseudonocardiaceae bacterium]|nr:hypothetical protein [Pseudonocardiaceae bacterium]